MEYQKEYEIWAKNLEGSEYEQEIASMKNDDALKEDSFYKNLEFGTAGMRGIIGIGTNRMNIFTVRRATKGLADYLNSEGKAESGVVIAYDSRIKSSEFALESALVLCKNGIKTYLFDTLTSVPILSHSILTLNCAAGIVITASHNPKQYNGYKVYGADGGQIANEGADKIVAYIENVKNIFDVETTTKEEALKSGLLEYVGKELYEHYYGEVLSLCMNMDVIKNQRDSLKVVYTPLHGTGNVPVTHILKELGIKNLYVVKSQQLPDGNFPTVKTPNPEEAQAFEQAIALAKEMNANLILGTDPDCDRLGVGILNTQGELKLLTGNQIGCLLLDYILMQKASSVKDGFAVKSIVSTNMADAIAKHYNVEMRGVLTGFKYIAEQIRLSLESSKGNFLFGFEESYGFLSGTFVRDKDAAIATMLVVEMACYYSSKGQTLLDALAGLYEKYGYYKEQVISITLSGIEGQKKIAGAVEYLRNNMPVKVGRFNIISHSDYKTGIKTDVKSGNKEIINLPSSNVLEFRSENEMFIVRPSGTEPKLKYYVFANGKTNEESQNAFDEFKQSVKELIESCIK